MKVPEGWRFGTVGSLCHFTNGNGFRPEEWKESGLPIIRIQNLNGSKDFNYYQGVVKPNWIVNPGDLLFAWAGVKGVSFGPSIWQGERGVLNQHIFSISSSNCEKQWLYYALVSVTSSIESNAHGFKSSLLHVHKSDITDSELAIPPLTEQRAIADTLSTWDTAIATLERLIAAKDRSFHHVRTQAIHDASRAHGALQPLSMVFKPVARKNSEGVTNVLTTSAQRGLVSQQTYFSKSVASENLQGYFLIKRGDFAYNRSSSNGYPYGAIKRLDDSERGVLSTLNICFSLTNSDEHSSDYFVHLFEAGYLNRGLSQICQEGARSHGLLNVSREDFFGLEIPIPDKATQVQIADKLNLVLSELNLLRSQLALLQRQKRGLMQKLLTGTWRVRISE